MYKKRSSKNFIRLFQILLIALFLWSLYWAHINDMLFLNKTFGETITNFSPYMVVYVFSIIIVVLTELYMQHNNEFPKFQKPMQSLYVENKLMGNKPVNAMATSTKKISLVLLIIGFVSLLFSIFYESTAFAFIGLGLVFFGVLFILISPSKLVSGNLLGATALSFYSTLDKVIEELKYSGKPLYVPSLSNDVNVPKHLVGLKDTVVFIPAVESSEIPSVEELAQKRFMIKNPEGICITPPGLGLLRLLETELRNGLSKISQDDFLDLLPVIVTKNLELASDFEIGIKNNVILVKVQNSVYGDLYSKNLQSVNDIGCPLVSSVACAIAKNFGKVIAIKEKVLCLSNKRIEVQYQIVEG